ncbi:MAG TPA: YbaB/EbfC family nucleoid-associated protein [Clostridia bacterium]|nr:YbaB/EbfC family nucleoid-associated protein [Clostridia bacterium]
MVQGFENLFEQAVKLKERLDELKVELAARRIPVTAGDGEVTLVFNGLQEVMEVKINLEGLPAPQRQRLETLLKRAINQGVIRAREVAGQEVAHYTGLNPSLINGLF